MVVVVIMVVVVVVVVLVSEASPQMERWMEIFILPCMPICGTYIHIYMSVYIYM